MKIVNKMHLKGPAASTDNVMTIAYDESKHQPNTSK